MSEDKVCVLYWYDGGWCFEHDYNEVNFNTREIKPLGDVYVGLQYSDGEISAVVEEEINRVRDIKMENILRKKIKIVISIATVITIAGLAIIVFG